jgi:hypothetical protein
MRLPNLAHSAEVQYECIGGMDDPGAAQLGAKSQSCFHLGASAGTAAIHLPLQRDGVVELLLAPPLEFGIEALIGIVVRKHPASLRGDTRKRLHPRP